MADTITRVLTMRYELGRKAMIVRFPRVGAGLNAQMVAEFGKIVGDSKAVYQIGEELAPRPLLSAQVVTTRITDALQMQEVTENE